jgi:hypothetical protein
MAIRRRFQDDSFRAVREAAFAAVVPHEAFADEIAIDFPSVARLVRRERDVFLGEDAGGDTLAADVSLSTRDAWTGTIIPLEVPIRGTCRFCGGRGETWTEPCGACCGTGDSLVRHPVQLSVPPRVADGACLRFRVSSPHAATVRVIVRVAIRSSAA